MFPIRDDNPHFLTPYVTYGLIGMNVLAWALLQGFGMEPALSSSVCRLGLVPADILQTAPAGTVPVRAVVAQVVPVADAYCTDQPARFTAELLLL